MSLNNIVIVKEFVKNEVYGIFDISADSDIGVEDLDYADSDDIAFNLREAMRKAQEIVSEYGVRFILLDGD